MAFKSEHHLRSGLVVTCYRSGKVLLETEDGDEFALLPEEVGDVARILDIYGRSASSNGQHPQPAPPPFPIVEAVVVEGTNGPVAVVDLAGEVQRMALRNAELLQQLSELEDLRDEMRGEG